MSKKLEFLTIVTIIRHYTRYFLGRKGKSVTDLWVIQWLYNSNDAHGLTARRLQKLATFDYEIQHRPGKTIGLADGLSRIPDVNQVTTFLNESKPQQTREVETLSAYKKSGILVQSKDSVPHFVSSDLKMSPGIARSFKHKFFCNFQESTNSPISLQHSDNQFISHEEVFYSESNL